MTFSAFSWSAAQNLLGAVLCSRDPERSLVLWAEAQNLGGSRPEIMSKPQTLRIYDFCFPHSFSKHLLSTYFSLTYICGGVTVESKPRAEIPSYKAVS